MKKPGLGEGGGNQELDDHMRWWGHMIGHIVAVRVVCDWYKRYGGAFFLYKKRVKEV